ncbi:nucleoporin FG repeat region-domain-containing protein [Mycena galopus ATCC 62051]|nr:nucleoporin FG repeat region-domain-containing protein [Mycena galopus ATCC 62051]
MAFPTSSAAFGIKPTAPANNVFGQKPATGLFGGQPQATALGGAFGQSQTNNAFGQPAAGGLFGQPQQNQQPAAGGNIFGQSQQPPTGGLFGQSQNQQQPATGGGLFGQPQNQQQPAAGGLFGQPQNQQQPAAGGGLFGQSQNQQPATGGLFGQPQNQQQQQPAAGGGLFGQPAQQPAAGGGLFGQSQTQQPTASGGLFGQPQSQQPAGGGLFGQTQTQQPAAGGLFGQPQNQQGGGLFGQSQNQPGGGLFGQSQNQQGGGLFGASQQNQQQPAAGTSGGLFGSTPLFGAPKPPGNGLFGATNPQQPQPLFGSTNANPLSNNNSKLSHNGSKEKLIYFRFAASQGPPPFTKSTKFNDLPDAVKKTLEDIDAHIQGRIQISKDLHQRKLGDEATTGQETIRAVHKDLINTTTAIRNDLHFTRDLKAKTDQAVQDTIVATRLVDGFRNPHANAAYLKDHAGFPLEFFTRVTLQMRQRLAWYKSTIEQIERKLSSANQTQSQYTPQGIHATLQAQHTTFLALAAKTAAVDAQLAKIKQIYTQLWRAKTGSRRDPFEDSGREEGEDLGFSGLRV